jgi:hypothetical protein
VYQQKIAIGGEAVTIHKQHHRTPRRRSAGIAGTRAPLVVRQSQHAHCWLQAPQLFSGSIRRTVIDKDHLKHGFRWQMLVKQGACSRTRTRRVAVDGNHYGHLHHHDT